MNQDHWFIWINEWVLGIHSSMNPWRWIKIILSFLRMHPNTAFWTTVDYEGYSISSKGFLPTVVDTIVIWIKFTHSCPFKFTDSSVQFSHSVVSNSLWPHELQHARPPCPSPTPGVHPNQCPLSWWCHPTISSSIIPFSSCPQSFPASRSFQMSQLFASGGQSIGVSASTSVLPMNTQDWYLIDWS